MFMKYKGFWLDLMLFRAQIKRTHKTFLIVINQCIHNIMCFNNVNTLNQTSFD